MRHGLGALVVEDSTHMCFLLKETLRDLDVRNVTTVASLSAAAYELALRKFDFALVDAGLGAENGLDFIRSVRRDSSSPHRRMPMLVVSGQGQRETIEAARDAGADGFMIKPVTRGALQAKLGCLLSRRANFIETATYFGPDRRRRQDPDYCGPERRGGGDCEYL
jgi:two-component system, chemotaxis family, chemotaxis protein CheY